MGGEGEGDLLQGVRGIDAPVEGETEGTKTENGVGFLASTLSSHQLVGLGSAVSSPSGVRGGDPTAQRFSNYFRHSRWPLLPL